VIPLSLAEVASALGGTLTLAPGTSPDTIVSGSVQTDSRLVEHGSIFFALPGAETDGALFATAAAEAAMKFLRCMNCLLSDTTDNN
jgi:UDP-N-acetylmuramoyl-tripeptide--D-alanyl-D-alanine ligase